MSNGDKSALRNVGRREMVKSVAAVGAAGSVAVTPVPELTRTAQAQPATTAREALESLTAAESDVLEAIAARLIPTDENGPGATEARAAHYIDRALAGPLAGSKAGYV